MLEMYISQDISHLSDLFLQIPQIFQAPHQVPQSCLAKGLTGSPGAPVVHDAVHGAFGQVAVLVSRDSELGEIHD